LIMIPLLPFAAGLLAGAAAVKLWRNDKAQAGIDSAREKLREATVAGLSRLESSTARARDRLAVTEETAPPVVSKPRRNSKSGSAAESAPKTPRRSRAKKVATPAGEDS